MIRDESGVIDLSWIFTPTFKNRRSRFLYAQFLYSYLPTDQRMDLSNIINLSKKKKKKTKDL